MLRIHGIPRWRGFRCLWAAERSGLPHGSISTRVGPAPQFAALATRALRDA